MIRISTADGRWHGNWSCDYLLSLQDLRLGDLVEEDDGNKKDAQVSVNLSVHKVTPFCLSNIQCDPISSKNHPQDSPIK